MKRVLLVVVVAGAAYFPDLTEPPNAESPLISAPNRSPAPVPTPPAIVAARDLTMRVRVDARLPVTCNAEQTNVPCIYPSGAICKLRQSNCTNLPCTEAAHETASCDAAVSSYNAGRKCLELRGYKGERDVRIFQGDSQTESAVAGLVTAPVRLCGDHERALDVSVNGSDKVRIPFPKSCTALDVTTAPPSITTCTTDKVREFENRL